MLKEDAIQEVNVQDKSLNPYFNGTCSKSSLKCTSNWKAYEKS